MASVNQNNVNVDFCDYGCLFFDNGELQEFVNFALMQQGLQPQHIVLPGVGGHGQGGFGGMFSLLSSRFSFGIECPRHHEQMSEVKSNGVEIDVCRYGCAFLDPNEINQYVSFLAGHYGYGQHQPVMPRIPHGRRVQDPHRAVFGMSQHHGRHGGGHRRSRSDSPFEFSDFFGSS